MKDMVGQATVKLKVRTVEPDKIDDLLFLEVAKMYLAKYGYIPNAWRQYIENRITALKSK